MKLKAYNSMSDSLSLSYFSSQSVDWFEAAQKLSLFTAFLFLKSFNS